MSAAAYVRYATHDVAFGDWSICVLRDAGQCDVAVEEDPASDRLRAKMAEDDAYRWDFDAVVTADAGLPAGRRGADGRDAARDQHARRRQGELHPRHTRRPDRYAFDPVAGRVVCAGDVTVKNSKTVNIEYPHFDEGPEEQKKMAEAETRVALERDLEMHLRYAAPKVLRAVGP